MDIYTYLNTGATNMKKRLLSILLTLILVLSIFPANSIVSAAGYDCFTISEKVSCTEKI